MNNYGKKLLKNTAILSIGTICTKGILFIIIPLLTRWVSQEEYGIFDLMITYVSLLIPFITFNCGEAAFRFLLDDDKNKNSIVTASVLITSIGFVFSTIILFIISLFVESIKPYLLLFIFLLVVEAVYNLLMLLLRGFKKLECYTISNIIYVFTMVIFSIVFVKVLNLGLFGLVISYSLGYLVAILYMIIVSKIYKNVSIKDFKVKQAKEMLKYSLPLIPNSISWWIMDASDRTIVSNVLGASNNAILAVAHKIPNLCQNFYNVFHLSWQENATETYNLEDRNNYYNTILNKMFIVLISISLLILGTNFIFFDFIFSSEYHSAYYQVPIFIISSIFSMLAQFIGGIFIAQKDSKTNGLTTTIAAIINIIVHLFLIRKIGLYAATISTLVSYIFLFVTRYVIISKYVKLKLDQKSILSFLLIIFISAMIYINNIILNVVILIFSIVYFMFINKEIIIKIKGKLLRRKA